MNDSLSSVVSLRSDEDGSGEQADGAIVIPDHIDAVGGEGSAACEFDSCGCKHVAESRWRGENKMGVDRHCGVAMGVRRKREGAVGQREERTAVEYLVEIEMLPSNHHRHGNGLLRDATKSESLGFGVRVSIEGFPDYRLSAVRCHVLPVNLQAAGSARPASRILMRS